MPRKRFLGASLLLHAGLFSLVVLASGIRFHGRAPATRVPPASLVKIVDLATPPPRQVAAADSPITYPHPIAPTPHPTPRSTPRPARHLRRPRRPTVAAHPRSTPKASGLAAYKKKLPELRSRSDAAKIAERLAQLGLDPLAAASLDSAVKVAINAEGDQLYHPTTPGAAVPASGSPLPFALPQAWASPSTPLEAFLDRILPPDRGYDYQLTYDAAGKPELRIRYRHGDLRNGGDLIFVERWDPGAAASPSVDVQVLSPDGKAIGHFAFPMLQAPGGSMDTFVEAMAGTAMIQWIQGAGH